MKRTASAVWTGGLKDGSGRLSSESRVLRDTPYAFANRFENEPGTNPEELIAAAHAGCFSMALSKALAGAGITPIRIATTAAVTLDLSDGPNITAVHLDVTVEGSGGDNDAFQQAAEGAKKNCPVSKVLNAEITMDARMTSSVEAG